MTDETPMPLTKVKVILPPGSPPERGPGWTDLWLREGTSDDDVLKECWILDTYHLRGLDLRLYEPSGGGWLIAGEENRRSRVIDIGAHTGIFAALVLQMFPLSEVVCIEPDAENFDLLTLNTQKWLHRSDLNRVAIGAERGWVNLWGSNATGHTVPAVVDGAPEAVEAVPLAGVIGGRPVSLLKMDCEGAEFDAIDACPSDTLALVDRIAMEWHGVREAPWVYEAPRRYGEMMTKLAYTHSMTAFGSPAAGGYAFGHRYDL